MQLPSHKRRRLLHPDIPYRFPHIGSETVWGGWYWRGAIVNIFYHGLDQSLLALRCQRGPVGLRPAIERPADAPHFFWHREVAHAHFAQIVVHVLTEPIEKRLAQPPKRRIIRQSVEDYRKMQHQQLKTSIDGIGNAIITIKTGQSRLRHDRAIHGGNGVLPLGAAKQGKFHRV